MENDLRFTLTETVGMVVSMRDVFVFEMIKHGIPPEEVTQIVDNVRGQIRESIVRDLEEILQN